MERIAFLCDGTACASKSNHNGCHQCSHTLDVEHAIHFEKNGDFFVERDPKDIQEIKEKLAAIESLLQRLPETQAAAFFLLLDEYQAARLAGKKANDLWEIPTPKQR